MWLSVTKLGLTNSSIDLDEPTHTLVPCWMPNKALHWVPMPTHAHGFWVVMGAILLFMGGHGCDIIDNVIGNVQFLNTRAHGWA